MSGRVIKFRAWNERLKTMESMWSLYWFEENGVHKNGDGDWVLEQFTGLLDSEGKEIYVGDIVEMDHGFFIWYGKVVVDLPVFHLIGVNGSTGFEMLMGAEDPMKIIGNIHDTHTTEAGR